MTRFRRVSGINDFVPLRIDTFSVITRSSCTLAYVCNSCTLTSGAKRFTCRGCYNFPLVIKSFKPRSVESFSVSCKSSS